MKLSNKDSASSIRELEDQPASPLGRKSLIFLILGLTLVVLLTTNALLFGRNLKEAYSHLVEDLRPEVNHQVDRIKQGEPITILFIGTSYEQLGRLGRKQAHVIKPIILLPNQQQILNIAIDPTIAIENLKTQTVLPLETYYTINGIESVVETFENIWQFPIDFIYEFDLNELSPLVTALGGLVIQSPEDLSFSDFALEDGKSYSLSARQVEEFIVSTGDEDQNYRQRQELVIFSLLDVLLNWAQLFEVPQRLELAQEAITTDLSWGHLQQLMRKGYFKAFSDPVLIDGTQLEKSLETNGAMIYDPQKVQEFRQQLKTIMAPIEESQLNSFD